MKLLWLDDYRDPHKDDWLNFSPIPKDDISEVIWVKSYHAFTNWILQNGLPDGICFDHDLENFHITKSTYKEYTGLSCAKWLVEYCIENNKKLPLYNIQSANPVGKENIDSYLKSFIKSQE